ncbi:MAG TPA: mannose-1-phosphate guanylyltransferase [Desulfomonilaceae bacterium]|nr:mannose-1-phosphate guanylyltransferase [Desulfomonilaceae bacterium]
MIHGVIMAGGSGTRFWPESRKNRPKQLLNIMGDQTMIRCTIRRILPEIPIERITVVTCASHADEMATQLPELNKEMIVIEPEGRNTAPCIALAAYKLHKRDPDGIMAVMPADHVIGKEEEFRQALRIAVQAACQGDHLVTFGVIPHRPETGYGYIKMGPAHLYVGTATLFKVDRFVEKPDLITAEQYVASRTYLWNSGMFVWQITSIIQAFEKYLPAIGTEMKRISPALNTPDESAAIAEAYGRMGAVSIDHGIMEKADNVLTLPVNVEWNDVGCWASLEDVWKQDECGNATKGRVMFVDGKRCVVSSPGKLTAVVGVEDLIIVDTPDALMVCRKDRAQDVRRLQELLKKQGFEHLL